MPVCGGGRGGAILKARWLSRPINDVLFNLSLFDGSYDEGMNNLVIRILCG